MTVLLEKITRESKQLSRQERERLAADLIASLDESPLTQVDEAWIRLAEQRLNDLLTGRVTGVSASRVFDRIRRDHGWNR